MSRPVFTNVKLDALARALTGDEILKVPGDVKLPTAILVKTKPRQKLDSMKRHGECYSDLILRILEEVELFYQLSKGAKERWTERVGRELHR